MIVQRNLPYLGKDSRHFYGGFRMLSMHSLLFFACLLGSSVGATKDLSYSAGTYEELQALVQAVKVNATLSNEFDSHFKEWAKLDTNPNVQQFSCKQSLSSGSVRANSVHRLTPKDIDVVAAIGDSITAGVGIEATVATGLLKEWRGHSWSIGGDKSVDEGVFTIPNMLKKFNPKVKGFSTGIIPVLSQGIFKKKAGYNMAVSGAKSKGILAQAQRLVKAMSAGSPVPVDMKNDWKLVTLFIGGNDLCAYCKNEASYAFGKYRDNLNATLSYLRDNLPRTLVNVVLMIDLTQLSEANGGFVCGLLHRLFCKCGSFPKTEVARQAMIEETVEYSESILDLIAKQNSYDKGDEFTVIAQPFLVNQRLPTTSDGKPDLSYFAPDCFHFSYKGHAAVAQALWNNMFEPSGRKRLSWFIKEGWNCPSKSNPYIFTYANSDQYRYTHDSDEFVEESRGSGGVLGAENSGGEQSRGSGGVLGAENSGGEQSRGSGGVLGAVNSGGEQAMQPQQSGNVAAQSPPAGSQSATTPIVLVACAAGVIIIAVVVLLAKAKQAKKRNGQKSENTSLL